MILIIASSQDPAGMNIADNMLEHHDFERIGDNIFEYTKKNAILNIISERSIYADYIEKKFDDVEANFFITRHSSEKGVHTLTVHTPGNYNGAMYGGVEGKICISNPIAQKIALQRMFKERDQYGLDYEVSLEATHHGPITSVPSTFFEVGSKMEQWKDKKAGEVVASATIEALRFNDMDYPKAIGVGGGHYPQRLSEIVKTTDWAVGHVIPKYAFPIDENRASELFNMNNGGETVIFDWKGTPNRTHYRDLFESLGYKTLKTKDLTN